MSSTAAATDAVLKYLSDANRPYSCVDVTANLRGAHAKAAVQRALDALSEGGRVRCKTYGKQRVYVALQADISVGSGSADGDLQELETSIAALTRDLTTITATLRARDLELRTLLASPSTETARSDLVAVKTSTGRLAARLRELSGAGVPVISAEEKDTLMEEYTKMVKEYKKRKRICSDMLDAMLEGCPKSKKCFIDELCMETDESVDFVLKNI